MRKEAYGAIAALVLTGLHADNVSGEGTTTTELPAVVVTASKVERSRGNVTQLVDLIGNTDIDRIVTGNRNIAEVLSYETGAAVSVLSRNDANWGSYGGLGPKYSTYMLGGLPIDAFVDTQALDPWALEGIEIQRGPASVLYPNYLSQDFAGNQSPLAGTVNLLPIRAVSSPLTKAEFGYGSYNTLSARLFHQNTIGDVSVFGGVSFEDSDYTDYGTEGSWLNMIDDPEYDKTKLYAGAYMPLSDDGRHSISVFANQAFHSGDAGRPNRGFDHAYSLVNGTYNLPLGDAVTAIASLGYRYYDRTWEDDNFSSGDLSLASDNGVKQTIVPTDLAFSIRHGQDDLLTIGADFQSADYETFSDPVNGSRAVGNDATASQFGLYVQEEQVLDQWVLRAGGRYTRASQDIDKIGGSAPGDDSESWDKLVWSAGVSCQTDLGLKPFANVGTSFLVPALKSVGGTLRSEDRGVVGRNGQLPNSDLDPESGISFDVGTEYEPGANLGLTVRGFVTVIDDAIVENVVSETPSQSQSVNAGKTTAIGVELDVRQRVHDRLSWFANYTYTDTDVENDVDGDQDGADVPFVPNHAANLGLTFGLPWDIEVSPYLHYHGEIYDSTSTSGRRKFDAYELLNVSVTKTLRVADSVDAKLFVNLYNVTDNDFEMPWQFQDPGFSASTGVSVTF